MTTDPNGSPPTPPDDRARHRRLNARIAAGGLAFGLTVAGLGVATAQTGGDDATTTTAAAQEEPTTETTAGGGPTTDDSTATTAPPKSTDPGAAGKPRQARPAETELTGDVAEKVKAAAVPGGTVVRVETDSDGSPYEAHVRRADGTEVVVKVNESFEVTATEQGGRPRR